MRLYFCSGVSAMNSTHYGNEPKPRASISFCGARRRFLDTHPSESRKKAAHPAAEFHPRRIRVFTQLFTDLRPTTAVSYKLQHLADFGLPSILELVPECLEVH